MQEHADRTLGAADKDLLYDIADPSQTNNRRYGLEFCSETLQ